MANPRTEVAAEKAPVENLKPGTAPVEQGIDSNKLQVGDVSGLKESQPKTSGALGDQLNAVYNAPGGPERFDNINKDLAKSFKSVYDRTIGDEATKNQAVKDFEKNINNSTVDGKGILAEVKDGKLTVRHLEATTSGEKHPEIKGVHIKDIGNRLTTDLAEKKLEKPGAPTGSTDKADTKQFPSDVLFQKAMTSSEDWAKAPWKAANASQQKLLDAMRDPKVAELAKSLPPGMVDAKAGTPKEVNDYLEKNGHPRMLVEREDEEAVAGITNIKKEWKATKSGLETPDGKRFAAIDKAGVVHNVDGKPVLELMKDPTDGTTIYAIPNKPGITGEQAMEQAKALIAKTNDSTAVSEGIIRAPMVDLAVTEDLNWLKGMKGGDLQISQAKMNTILKMDENGFDAKQAIAMSATRGFQMMKEPKFTINTDFTFVVAKDGKPIFAMPVGQDSWKDPKRK
ncbi:MAG: hypothetical protein SGJ27_29545 [Candidatus Melainabacteria bacterium]|nr:hypothetical protein [Candidatus Melainabacteria bacterium]